LENSQPRIEEIKLSNLPAYDERDFSLTHDNPAMEERIKKSDIRACSLSNKHYKTRLQLKEFRDKYCNSKNLNDDVSSMTEDAASRKPSERGNANKTLFESDTFGNLKEYKTIDFTEKSNHMI